MDIALIAQIATDRRAPFFPYLLYLAVCVKQNADYRGRAGHA